MSQIIHMDWQGLLTEELPDTARIPCAIICFTFDACYDGDSTFRAKTGNTLGQATAPGGAHESEG